MPRKRRSVSRSNALTVVVLAAGSAQRFGSQKLLHPLPEGDTLLSRAIRAAGSYEALVVCSREVEPRARALGARTVLNVEPEKGMWNSAWVGNAAVDVANDVAVLPADLLLIESEHVARIAALANGVDVVYPRRSDGTPGHPVLFAAGARWRIADLAIAQEPVSAARDEPALSRRIIEIDEDWPYRDVDMRSDLP